MAHEVETMFYTREKPWHGLGTMVMEALTSSDALRMAGLDWKVEGKPIFNANGLPIEGYRANTRDSDDSVLGIVGSRYSIVQNDEAFAFTDSLIGGDVRYETAGSLREGRKIWLLAKMPETKVAGDEVEPYLCFTNTYDGSGAIQVCMTPVRVVCNNTLNLALRSAKRVWSVRHTGDMQSKMQEAKQTLELAGKYMEHLGVYADQKANTKISDEKLADILKDLFPAKETDSAVVQERAKKAKEEFMVCYYMPDLSDFRGTAWGVINAAADMAGHAKPNRQTANYAENNFDRILAGHALLDSVSARV